MCVGWWWWCGGGRGRINGPWPLVAGEFLIHFIAEREYVCVAGERNHFGMRSPQRLMTSLQRAGNSLAKPSNPRPPSELCPEWVAQAKEYKGKVEKEAQFTAPTSKRNDGLEDLHEQYLKAMGETSQATINKDMLDAQIKAACGTAKGIEGICTWNRIQKQTTGFSATALAEAEPELHQKYLVERDPTHSLSVNLMRSYPFG